MPSANLFIRTWCQLLAIVLCGMLCLHAPDSAPAAESAPSVKPNFVVFLIDDLGWNDIACYGRTLYETPHIDRLASQGMKWNCAYAACCVCSPSRAALLTGKYPARLHLTDIVQGTPPPGTKLRVPDWTRYLPLEEITLAEALKPAGYVSANIGKWHLGGFENFSATGDGREADPIAQGFDVNVAGSEQGQAPDYFFPYKRKVLLPKPGSTEKVEKEFDIPKLPGGQVGEFLTERLTTEAVKFIQQNRERPFFLYFSHFTVHTSIGARLQAKPATIAKYEAKLKNQPEQKQRNATYAAMVESMDDSVGQVLHALDELKIADRTIVIFTSDNGALQNTTSLSPLRGWKGTAYEGGVRVPLIIKWPGAIQPGSTSDVPVIGMDLYPTILEIAGVERVAKQALDGESLVPLMKQTNALKRDAIYWHYPHYGYATKPYGSMRQGDWKLIEYFESGEFELFDLKNDIGEIQNLVATSPAKVRAMHQQMLEWRRQVGAQMPTKGM